jgi:monodechloroaminopyrrolnitrin synthase
VRGSLGTLDYAAGVPAAAVAKLDPLNADQVCAGLPAMNRRGEVSELAAALRRIMPTNFQVSEFTPVECLAAMRDIGMLLCSIKRHGVQPVPTVPEIEPILLALASRTNLVPRDTLQHYTCWNPRGTRRRTFTGDPQETHLIGAVCTAMPRLSRAITTCERVIILEPGDPECAVRLDEIAWQLRVMVDAIDRVMAHVSPTFFARGLRPFFEEVTVAGRSYLGPAAATMPIALVDLALWASDHGDGPYTAFHRGAIDYSPPHWRKLYRVWLERPSLAHTITTKLATDPGATDSTVHASGLALCRVLRVLTVFRGKHLTIARRAYHEDLRLYPVGSGGGNVELLTHILDLTRTVSAQVNHGRPASLPTARCSASADARRGSVWT